MICAFFGHRCWGYDSYKGMMTDIIRDLIVNKGVTQFYSGWRGEFDRFSAELVAEIRDNEFPNIENILVLSYMPTYDPLGGSDIFNGSVYLLEKSVPPKFAITHTNRALVELSDYIVSGVFTDHGGAYTAVRYAQRLKKTIISLPKQDFPDIPLSELFKH